MIAKDKVLVFGGKQAGLEYSPSNKVFLIPEGLSIDSEANDWLKKDLFFGEIFGLYIGA